MFDFLDISANCDFNCVNTYNLSIWLRSDGLSFAVFDPVTNSVVGVGESNFGEEDLHWTKHQQCLLTEDIFAYDYRKISVVIENKAFCLVPKMLYSGDNAGKMLEFVGIQVAPTDVALFDDIEMAKARLLYTLPSFLYNLLLSKFKMATIVNAATTLMNTSLAKRNGSEAVNTVRVNISADGVLVAVVTDFKLTLCNRYNYSDTADLVYVIVNVLEQLKINDASTRLTVGGSTANIPDVVALLERFTENVVLAEAPTYFNYHIKRLDNKWRYSNLLNTFL